MKINGTHSNTISGLIVRSVRRPLLPKQRVQYETIPGRHGSIDYSDGSVEDAIISVVFSLIGESLEDKRQKVRTLAPWLYGQGQKVKVEFDDEPGFYYLGRYASQIDPEQVATVDEFTVQFRCDPFAYATETISETVFTTTPYPIVVTSNGTAETSPTITVTNEGSNTINGFILQNENLAN